MTKNGLRVIAQLILLLVLSSVSQAQTADNVTVDFSSDQGAVTYRASGFLHGFNSTTPVSADITPLKPQMLRSDFTDFGSDPNTYARSVSLGVTKNIFILGDDWIGNKGGFNPSGGRIVTSGQLSNWASMVALDVNTAISNGQTFQWDIWNEPDISVFWTGTEAQYQAAWQTAVNTIRGINSGQIIVGPSTCCSPWGSFATDLMAFAKTNNVLPNIVAIHENTSPSQLESDVSAVKSYLAANDPGITQVDTTEIIDQGDTYNAGTVLQFLAAAEHAGVGAAARSCWNSDCFDNSLDGLTNNGLIAAWYAYQAYANITGRLVNVTPTSNVDGIAGQDSTLQQAYSVFGRNSSPGTINITFSNISGGANYLTATGSIHVNAFQLQNDSGSGSSGPVQIINTDYTVSADQIVVVVPSLGSNDVAILQLTPGAGAGSSSNKPNPPSGLTAVVLLN
jgi:hypothetical protein